MREGAPPSTWFTMKFREPNAGFHGANMVRLIVTPIADQPGRDAAVCREHEVNRAFYHGTPRLDV